MSASPARHHPIAEIGPGSPVGEIAFLAGGVRTATVTAARDSLVLKLGREQFDRLCASTPAIWRTLTAALAPASCRSNRRPGHARRRHPAHHHDHPGRPRPVPSRFVSGLEAVLRQFGSVALVRSDNLRRMLGGHTDLNSGAAMQALNALESAHQFVLYLADPELTPWSEKAIRQADQVLRVGTAARETRADVPQNRLEEFACRPPAAESPATRPAARQPRHRQPARRVGSAPATSACITTWR